MRTPMGVVGLVLALSTCGEAPPETGEAGNSTPAPAPAEVPNISVNPDRNAYFGDLHVHTKNSFDAYIFGTRSTPDDAYRFAKGEPIRHDGGYEIKLAGPPLDFLAVTDHGEYMGVVPAMAGNTHPVSQTPIAQAVFGPDAANPTASFLQVGATVVSGEEIEEIYDRELIDSVWGEAIAAADRHNAPGTFTTFAGYEFTAMRLVGRPQDLSAANLHRNVIFRDAAPERLFSTLDSPNPEDLWDWMDDQRASGRDVISIPHNSNASDGEMFATETYTGDALTAAWARQRLANEPVVEMTQLKGTSETHPMFSPNDEFAGFEQYEYFIGSRVKATINEGDFVRPAYGRGLGIEKDIGVNPYQFGMIGSSDTHIAAATLVEETHWGKFPTDGGDPVARSSVPPEGARSWQAGEGADDPRRFSAGQYSSSGLAGVWAEANTRDEIFAAMQRRETFGTSGPRIRVRLFAGTDFEPTIMDAPDLVAQADAGGVPMGGELVSGDTSPGFVAWAMRDPRSAPLERMQMIKVWTEDGRPQEQIYDIACSGGAAPDPDTRRCPDNGARVDPANCATEGGNGAPELRTFWRDPDYQPGEQALYYVRVLENPTCRWSTWDAIRAGTPPNPDLPLTLRERAWTSPIWVK